jgi:hypothetical protein
MLMNESDHQENDVHEFIDEFKTISQKLYNLKTLQIMSPFATYDGVLVKKLLDIRATYTRLELDMFAFHSHINGMWTSPGVTLKNLDVTFHDGIAFPNAGSDFFKGLDDNMDIDEIKIRNESPYTPVVILPRKLRSKTYIARGVKLSYR